jgi:membrane protein YqaA with SNARE-associated domain
MTRLAAIFAAPAPAPSPRRPSTMRWIVGFGLPGVFLYSLLDSSPIPLPGGGVDILTILLAARHREWWGWYGLVATAGGLIGAAITYHLAAAGGSQRLLRRLGSGRTAGLAEGLQHRGWMAVMAASFMPPPFPFTAFLLAAGALRIPRVRFFSALAVGRAIRFGVDAYLGDRYGRTVVRLLRRSQPTPAHVALAIAAAAIATVAFWLVWRQRAVKQIAN